ncbi:MAG: serine/threonine protein phosphatase [Bacteroidales bacterium]|nr:serine/threonine protein phosphatase [Bacteroidales bacterium]
MKKWVIPDLHGCEKTLIALVENHIKPEKSDVLYFLGDYIDRGPNPKGVLDYIMNLQNDGFDARPLRGNHEEYLVLAYNFAKQQKQKFLFRKQQNKLFNEWIRHGGSFTLNSFGVKKVLDIPEKYINWLQKLPHYFEDGKYVIVHAGLNFDRLDPYEDKHAMLWSKAFNPVTEKIDNKIIIHGHVPVSFDFIKTTLSNPHRKYIALDNGCYLPHKEGMGNLVGLELNSLELVMQRSME